MNIKEINVNANDFSTGSIEATKGFGCLIVASDAEFNDLADEQITIKVEKSNGSDEYIAQDVLLRDFIALSVYGGNCMFPDRDNAYKYVAFCDLTKNGGSIELSEGEKIVISMKNLMLNQDDGVTPVKYKLNGFEEALTTRDLYRFERKSIHADSITHDLNVEGYDLISLQNDASITEIALTYENGRRCVYTRFELDTMAAMVDPLSRVKNNQAYTYIDGRIVFPLRGVSAINVRKTAGTRLEVHLRTENEYILT